MAKIDYVLGHSDIEIRRLELSGSYFSPGIERVLRTAGLKPGMSVLDVGTGAGDVALLAGRIVGPSGSVLGVDPAESALDRARVRTQAAGLKHVGYEALKLEDLSKTERFDFVIGSRVIGHVPDPVAHLREAAVRVRPDGVLLQFEVSPPQPELPNLRTGYRWSVPPVPLFDQVADLCMAAFMFGKSRASDGGQRVRLFYEAGLPEPRLAWEEQVCGPSGPVVESLYLTFRALLPALEKYGVDPAITMEIDTLNSRMRAAVADAHSQVRFDNLVSAWTTLDTYDGF